jgi:hypothetical protein
VWGCWEVEGYGEARRSARSSNCAREIRAAPPLSIRILDFRVRGGEIVGPGNRVRAKFRPGMAPEKLGRLRGPEPGPNEPGMSR